jgi:hypothetical protein
MRGRTALFVAALSFGALGSCGGREGERPSVTVETPDARTVHAETLRAFALTPGTVWSWSQRAELEYGRFDGEREEIEQRFTWTVAFDERVTSVRTEGSRVLVELERTLGAVEGEPPSEDEDLGITPRAERWVWVVDAATVTPGASGIFEQESYDPIALEDAPLVWALPFKLNGVWHEDGEGRHRSVAEVLERVQVGAGTFPRCHRIVRQWTIDEDEEWVCDGVGPVRRRVSGTHANFRQLREATLLRFSRPNPLLAATAPS